MSAIGSERYSTVENEDDFDRPLALSTPNDQELIVPRQNACAVYSDMTESETEHMHIPMCTINHGDRPFRFTENRSVSGFSESLSQRPSTLFDSPTPSQPASPFNVSFM